MQATSGSNVHALRSLPTPAELREALPISDEQAALVLRSRETIRRVLDGQDPRLLAIVGPCSIHDPEAGREYAARLADLAEELQDRFVIVMRTYLEKPRTTTGWKGMILDPHLNGSGDVARGLHQARAFLLDVLNLGLPTATEFLDPISPQYIADLVCWTAIGARSSESQMHRQLASGLSMPLGFKNSTDGGIQTAINAIKASSEPDTFLGIGTDGRAAAVYTSGNRHCHIVLRGGSNGPNYSSSHIKAAEAALRKVNLKPGLIVDCSHDNSGRQPGRQPEVLRHVIHQVAAGNRSIIGVMLESNLFGGSQQLTGDVGALKYGVSVTDPCLDWDATEDSLREAHAALAPVFKRSHQHSPVLVLNPVTEV